MWGGVEFTGPPDICAVYSIHTACRVVLLKRIFSYDLLISSTVEHLLFALLLL